MRATSKYGADVVCEACGRVGHAFDYDLRDGHCHGIDWLGGQSWRRCREYTYKLLDVEVDGHLRQFCRSHVPRKGVVTHDPFSDPLPIPEPRKRWWQRCTTAPPAPAALCPVCASVDDPNRTSLFEYNDDCTLVRTVTTTCWRTA